MRITIKPHGTVTLITANDPDALEWLAEHLDPDSARSGSTWYCEPRYVPEIALGFFDDGGGVTVGALKMAHIERA